MKKYNIPSSSLLFLLLACLLGFSACNDEFLNEVPKSFLSPENAYTDRAGFEAAINHMYLVGRTLRTHENLPGAEADKGTQTLYGSGTDLGWYWDKKNYFGDYTTINSFNAMATGYWRKLYNIIKNANIIVTRSEYPEVNWDSEEEKQEIQAHARFFRAYAYRFLVHLYGDVPLLLEEITGPRLDFERAPKADVLAQIIADLEFARQYLPVSNPDLGRLSQAAADHLLAEIYITTGQYDKAIAAATNVIDDPQYELMTERFGTMTDKPGDVFWDLHRLGNHDRSSGNMETILAWQIEFNVPGGGSGNRLERCWGPLLEQIKTPDGLGAILKNDLLGRPVAFMRPSAYMEYTLWESDWDNDMRNSEYNMQRKFYINNPASAHFGELIVPNPADTVRRHFVWVKKASHPYGHPQGYDNSGRLYSDMYAMRLAETYLLRAEAYLSKGDLENAAADINIVRARSNATPVEPAAVDIDYLLDERARELMVEEPRRLTLARLGLLDDRIKKYNPVSAPTIQEFHNLWPIPQSEIDANQEASIVQNPGY